jgi:hypothetical protein
MVSQLEGGSVVLVPFKAVTLRLGSLRPLEADFSCFASGCNIDFLKEERAGAAADCIDAIEAGIAGDASRLRLRFLGPAVVRRSSISVVSAEERAELLSFS